MEHGANNFAEIIFGPIDYQIDYVGLIDYELDQDHRQIIEWMLDLGANPGEILAIAAREGYQDIAELVLEYSSEDLQQIDYNQAMIAATEGGNINIIELLLNFDQVNVNYIDQVRGDTALMKAVGRSDNDNIIQLLFIQYS